jgi:hypothetical protein
MYEVVLDGKRTSPAAANFLMLGPNLATARTILARSTARVVLRHGGIRQLMFRRISGCRTSFRRDGSGSSAIYFGGYERGLPVRGERKFGSPMAP